MISLNNIQKSFGNYPVLAIEKLVLPLGLYWLRGKNGSGKSTLLNILAGLIPFKGDVVLNENIHIRKHPVAYRKLINHAAAEPVYPAFLPGTDLVEFVTSIKGGSADQVDTVKKSLDIGNYLANPTGSYSSGMLKKLSLLLAFIGNPAWVLLDEPFSTLDQASQKALCILIREKHEQGISFILTSHHDIEPDEINFTQTFILKDQKLTETNPV